jgi:hypothetical protein
MFKTAFSNSIVGRKTFGFLDSLWKTFVEDLRVQVAPPQATQIKM